MSPPLVVAFPDPRLARQAAIVESFDEALQLDARLLLDSLRTIPAIGLAGPHLGIMRRIIAIDLKSAGQPGSPHVYVNPIVTWCSTETAAFEEGSVSLPGVGRRSCALRGSGYPGPRHQANFMRGSSRASWPHACSMRSTSARAPSSLGASVAFEARPCARPLSEAAEKRLNSDPIASHFIRGRG